MGLASRGPQVVRPQSRIKDAPLAMLAPASLPGLPGPLALQVFVDRREFDVGVLVADLADRAVQDTMREVNCVCPRLDV